MATGISAPAPSAARQLPSLPALQTPAPLRQDPREPFLARTKGGHYLHLYLRGRWTWKGLGFLGPPSIPFLN